MRFNFITYLAFVSAAAMAGAIPIVADDVDTNATSANPEAALTTRAESYRCGGSLMCGSALHLGRCDKTVNHHLVRNDEVLYGAAGSGRSMDGACPKGTYSACKIFIQGAPHCARSGNQMWHDYQDIRKKGKCNGGRNNCGTKFWGDGCQTTVDYIYWCPE